MCGANRRNTVLQFYGLALGVWALLSIGLGHMWVIKVEYHVGAHIWPVPVVVGQAFVLASLWASHPLVSAMLGIFGFTLIWGARELIMQQERVERGWFPRNPKKGPSP